MMGELDAAARRLEPAPDSIAHRHERAFPPVGRFYPSGGTRAAKTTLLAALLALCRQRSGS